MRYRTDRLGRLAEVAPDRCPQGHPLGPRACLVGWLPCSCRERQGGGHRTWSCRRCGAVIYDPEHDPTSGTTVADSGLAPPTTG